MSSLPKSSQWKHEAQRLDDEARVNPATEIPRDERIEFQKEDEYLPPSALKLTATKEEYERLCGILESLRNVNNEFVGELIEEVEGYLATSGGYDDLSRNMREWCESYFGRRVRKYNPRDQGDVGRTWKRLEGEIDDVLGRLRERRKCINLLYLNESVYYVRWLLGHEVLATLCKDGAKLRHEVWSAFLQKHGLLYDYLSAFVKIVTDFGDRDRLVRIAAETDMAITQQLFERAYEINEMRPFLVRGFDFAKTVIDLNDRFCIGWDWATRYGIGEVLSDQSWESMIEHYTQRVGILPVKLRSDGILIDGRKPWLSTANVASVSGIKPIAVNLYVVEQLHEKLFSFYDKIDINSIIKRGKKATDDESNDDVIAAVNRRLAEMDPEPETTPVDDGVPRDRPRKLRKLYLWRFLRFLKDNFSCEIRDGKGSEINVYRPGYKHKSLRRHKQNPGINELDIKRTLKCLGISAAEYCLAAEKTLPEALS